MPPLRLLSALLLAGPFCFGDETNSPGWARAFFSGRLELSLPPPKDPGLTLRWSADGLTPRPGAQRWTGPLAFSESAPFHFRLFREDEPVGEPVPLALVRLASSAAAEADAGGLWTSLPSGPWAPREAPFLLSPGSLARGVLRVIRPGIHRLRWSDGLLSVGLGQFSFTQATAAEPFWIEAGDYRFSAEVSPAASGDVALDLTPVDAAVPPAQFRRSSLPPASSVSWVPTSPAASPALDGRLGTSWQVPSASEDATWKLSFFSPAETVVLYTEASLRAFPARLAGADGSLVKPIPVGPGRFHCSFAHPSASLALTQPAGAPAWSLAEIQPLPPEIRPLEDVSFNCLPGEDLTALPSLRRLAALATDLWPRFARTARHDPRSFPRQLWIVAMPTASEPVRIVGRHILVARNALDGDKTPSLLVQKLGELAARPVGGSPFDVSQGLGAGVVLLTLGADRALPGGTIFTLPEAARAQRLALAAAGHRDAFAKLIEAARGGWNVSMWNQFEAAALNQKTTEK